MFLLLFILGGAKVRYFSQFCSIILRFFQKTDLPFFLTFLNEIVKMTVFLLEVTIFITKNTLFNILRIK